MVVTPGLIAIGTPTALQHLQVPDRVGGNSSTKMQGPYLLTSSRALRGAHPSSTVSLYGVKQQQRESNRGTVFANLEGELNTGQKLPPNSLARRGSRQITAWVLIGRRVGH